MATQFEIECALMAGRAYMTNRSENNRFPVPEGWRGFAHVPNDAYPTTDGFEAISFSRTDNPNKIVISFAGTDGLLTAALRGQLRYLFEEQSCHVAHALN